ncbi:MAG TPA: alpha/beta hydrolase [Ktedonobacteraceae bacterium]|nr:alpha/beta hydrolase [Ktedonobacteraceae bacterium]
MKYLASLLVVALLVVEGVFYAHPAAALSAPQCQQQDVVVALAAGQAPAYHLAGWLCWQGTLADKTVQLLTPGGTYDHTYWDFSLQPDVYSYVRAATAQGYATFNYDRLGTGLSDHPAPLAVTFPAETYILHQLVQQTRAGTITGAPVTKVLHVGHSYGSMVAVNEAATYHDVDGVVLTGFTHAAGIPGTVLGAVTSTVPTQLDPKFASANLPIGYTTTLAGTRGLSFYNTAFADPAVIAQDESLKQTATTGESLTLTPGLSASLSQQIAAPVLLAVGQKDQVFCTPTIAAESCNDTATVLARENSDFSPSACLEAYVQPDAGHVIALHPNAPAGFAAMLDWANRRVGASATQAATDPCQ